ncbi:hypothetical protein [Actinokineospora diospyrosa]|uniref:Barstar (Barnase inhibitor) n=1 Tax=Actinokineospora diospyrosa TaxID=103728 RepID=A0ABT1IEH8_9PSEU|nr:hypothetical protein [Actinokineospora diospyrosa]MCP2271046.1 hypothetical protein [Actinokineospora diospyrosa]
MIDLRTAPDREYFAVVATHLGMFIGRSSYAGATAFLDGYDSAARRLGGTLLDGFREWLMARRGHECNHAWPGVVLHLALPEGWTNSADLPPEAETRAITVLFELLDEFLAERESS